MPCGGIDGCWHTGLVNTGYYPYETVSPRTPMRYGPAHDAPVILVLELKRSRFAAQSTRNPDNDNNPPRRPAVDGFVWGYSHSRGTSGWIEFAALTSEDSGEVWATGPAKADFQVGASRSVRHGRNSSCAGERGSKLREVKAADVYLRYAPHSTPYWYVEQGDVIRERWRGRRHDVCVEVVRSKLCPAGTRGWLPYAALSRKAMHA